MPPDAKMPPGPDAEGTSAREEVPPGADAPDEPGVTEAIGGVRAAFMRMLEAHFRLLRAELEITGRELSIIVGLAAGAFALLILVAILLYVGSFLFFGELLFGSMGWGIIHGTLLGAAIIGFVAIDLAGGDGRAYGWGAVIGIIVTVVLAALLVSNVGNEAGEWGSRLVQDNFVTEDLPFGSEWHVTLIGLVVGAVIGGVAALIMAWRVQFGRPFASLVIGLVLGAFIGATYTSTRYDAVDGVLGLAIMVGLLTWIIVGIALAARRGFDPEARYADLIPRASIAAFERAKVLMTEQWERQKNRMMGR